MLDDNRLEYTREQTRGVPREGTALLQGIVYCGESGHKMCVVYKQRPQYRCVELRRRYGGPLCQHILAEPVDRHVVAAFLEALSPAQLDIHQEVVRQHHAAQQQIERGQRQQQERLRYTAALAERQFRRVDPDNRLVAAELERRWEEALRELQQAEEAEHQRACAASPEALLPPSLRAALQDLSRELPAVWHAGLLSHAQKKALLRSLIDKVVIHRAVPECVHTRIVWRGGDTTTLEVPLAVGLYRSLSRAPEMEARILALQQEGCDDQQIAARLSTEGHRSPRSERVLKSTVRNVRLWHRRFLDRHQSDPDRPAGHLPVAVLAKRLGVSENWVYARIYSGRIQVRRDPATDLYLFPDDAKTLQELEELKASRTKVVYL